MSPVSLPVWSRHPAELDVRRRAAAHRCADRERVVDQVGIVSEQRHGFAQRISKREHLAKRDARETIVQLALLVISDIRKRMLAFGWLDFRMVERTGHESRVDAKRPKRRQQEIN